MRISRIPPLAFVRFPSYSAHDHHFLSVQTTNFAHPAHFFLSLHITYRVYSDGEFWSETVVHGSCHLLIVSCLQVNLSKTFNLHAAAGTFVVSEFCNSQMKNKALSSAPSQYNSCDYRRTKQHCKSALPIILIGLQMRCRVVFG